MVCQDLAFYLIDLHEPLIEKMYIFQSFQNYPCVEHYFLEVPDRIRYICFIWPLVAAKKVTQKEGSSKSEIKSYNINSIDIC